MVITQFNVRITGAPQNYHVQLEAFGEADSIAELRERLQPIVGNIRLTTAEVDADLAASGSYVARSLPAVPGTADLA
jgi:hypothetical protein